MMDTTLRVLLSSPKREHLSEPQQLFVDAFEDHITHNGLRLVYLDSPASDRLDVRLQQFKTCHGVVVLALGQWEGRRLNRRRGTTLVFPSEFSHVATVMAVAAGKPLLVLREKSVAERGALREGYIPASVELPRSLDITWLGGTEFRSEFTKWLDQVKCFRHVFLGLSEGNTSAALRRHVRTRGGARAGPGVPGLDPLVSVA